MLPVALELWEDGPQWIRGHHHNFVGLEIMAKLPGHYEYSIKELMRLGIPGLGFMQDLADVVDQLLDGLDFSSGTGPFSLRWGFSGPQVFWLFPRSGSGRIPQSKAGCLIGGGQTSTFYKGDHGSSLYELLGSLCD
jgi:hypothetical protein